MEKIVSRQKNLIVLALVVFMQVVALGVQVKRPSDAGPVSLVRLWTIRVITPFEKAFVHTSEWVGDTWQSYFYLRGLKAENERLENENAQLRLQQVRMIQDASQAQRLQALLKFKEQVISESVAAQVIGTSGSETSRILYIDKGTNDGLKNDMAVITPGGVVGKIIRVLPGTAQVLEINDQTSGVGVILEKSRLQGILKGTPAGEALIHYIMSDEKVEIGETVLTSGGDRIFPKGLPVGRVVSANPGKDMFLSIRVKPSARLDRVEEVLVITKVDEHQPDLLPENPQRASDILASRLPSIPVKPPDTVPGAPGTPGQPSAQSPVNAAGAQQTGTTAASGNAKPSTTPAQNSVPERTKPVVQNGTAVATPAGSGPGTARMAPSAVGTKTTKAKPGEPNVYVNGNGVKHVSDVPNGSAKPPRKPGQ